MSAEIGILLVHGIGSQNRGETLVTFGEPLFKTIRKGVESPEPLITDGDDLKSSEPRSDASPAKGGQVHLLDSFLSPHRQ